MANGLLILALLIIAAILGALWGLWRGEKRNDELRKKNLELYRGLKSEQESNRMLRKWALFYRRKALTDDLYHKEK